MLGVARALWHRPKQPQRAKLAESVAGWRRKIISHNYSEVAKALVLLSQKAAAD
jgi:hypothetical protein